MQRVVLFLALFMFSVPSAEACVGKTLHIGVVNTVEGQVIAEMLSSLINERTGTTIAIKYFKNMQEVHEAVKVKQVDITVENAGDALRLMNRPAEADAKKAYDSVKSIQEKEMGLIWLKPFGFTGVRSGAASYTAAVLRAEVINSFPVLPRVIDKLGSVISDEAHARLVKSVESGEKPKKVARDFLKSKKLI